ncbi:transcription factor MYB124-like isoform X1 [Silene latifolia]|uniref:transcription factor MYB124-like isoform X1 n=1 Tax=Silene latifolia TaxID=37657 RepID=UPI003D781D37
MMMMKQPNNEDSSTNASYKPKERRIVTWTQEEDDILRDQISIHGTDNWTIIASNFKDKTTRQCRRRWYTYLNSDFKKGGWSPEEDMLLCEAQKIFGNRWTEIAKVVSGRTDNAVKNRFSTLCKKKAKREALAKENSSTSINANNKRVLVDNGFSSTGMVDIASPFKKLRRSHILNRVENFVSGNILHKNSGTTTELLRRPFAVLTQNDSKVDNLLVSTTQEMVINDNKKVEGTYLRKDDPKVAALVQQAELLSSLAVKVNMDNTEQSLENAWKVLQNHFDKNNMSDRLKCKITDVGFQLDDFKELMKDLRSDKGIQLHEREPDMYESSSSSEYSTGSTTLSHTANDQVEQSHLEICTMHDEIEADTQSLKIGDNGCVDMPGSKHISCAAVGQESSSPVQVTPIFRSMASTIPSPQFSESERHFLLKTLGIESPAQNNISNPLQPPPCRKALLQGL